MIEFSVKLLPGFLNGYTKDYLKEGSIAMVVSFLKIRIEY